MRAPTVGALYMPDAPATVLFVTREMAGDRRYGIGRSLMPIVEVLQARG